MTKRIGFACKWIDRPDQLDGIKPKEIIFSVRLEYDPERDTEETGVINH
jgi:hypothetical protein